MNKKTTLAIAVGAICSSSALYAQDVLTLDEVVVSATRTEQSKADVSSSIETISADDINETMAGDIKQALQYTPGVSAQGSGRFGVSGFNIRGMEQSRIKMMIDDVQQPVAYNPGASEQRKYPNAIELDTLQVIEVNKGPSSTLYGSDALGGVVLLRTKNPEDVLLTDGDENRFGIKSSYASANEEFKNTLTWAMRKDKLETIVMATYANGSETKAHDSGLDVEGPDRGLANPADSQIGNLLAKAYYQATDEHRFGLIAEYYEKQYDEDELHYNGYTIMPGFTYTDNYNEDTNKRLRIGFEHSWLLDTAVTDSLDWSINYQDSSTLNKNYDTTQMNGRRMRERDATDTSIQFNGQASKLVEFANNPHEFTYGVNYVKTDFSLENTDYKFDQGTVTPGSTGIPDAELIQWGFFLQDQAYLMEDRLILTAGLRYDSYEAKPSTDEGFDTEYKDNKNDALTGRLGAVYHLNEQLSAFGQISQGFKAPTVYDLYYFYDTGATVIPNPNLEAEKSISYEAGFRGRNESTQFEITAFFNDYTDFIAQETLAADTYTKTNLDEVEIYGAEFSSTTDLAAAFSAPQGMYSKFALTYVDGKDKKTGDALDSVAPLTANLGLGYDRQTFGALANVQMVAAKTDWATENNIDAPGYTVVDFTAFYRPMQDLTLRAGLFNAFDKKYWLYDDIAGTDPHSSSFSVDRHTQPGRNWGISLEYFM